MVVRECLKDGCQWQGSELDDVLDYCPECGAGPEDQVFIDDRMVPNLECYA